MKFAKYALLTMSLLASGAHAKFVETDWNASGDALATLDTESGLEWLDLSVTVGMSIESIQQSMGAGEQFDGWRLPDFTEIQFLMTEGLFEGGFTKSGDYVSSSYTEGVSEFYRLHGYTRDFDRSYGMYIHDGGEVRIFGVANSNNIKINVDHSVYPNSGPYTFSHPLHGVWLVSEGGATLSSMSNAQINNPTHWANGGTLAASSVSSPLLGFAGLSLLGVAALGRKKRK